SITSNPFPPFGHFKNHPDSTLGRGSFISRFGNKINKPSITRSLPFLFCDGDSIEFAAELKENSEYFWNIDGELSDKKSNRIVVSNEYMSKAFNPIISLAVMDKSENCISQSGDLSVYPRLTISDNVLCSNSVGLLAKTDSTTYSYSWKMNGNLIVGQDKPRMLITKGGIYSVIVSDHSLNCRAESNEVEVFESQIPLPVLSKDKDSYCEGNSAVIESNWVPNGNLMNWLFNGKFIGLESVKGISTKTEGEFSVLVEDIHGCKMTSNSVAIKFNSLPSIEIKQIADTLKAPSGLKSYQWFKNESAIAGATNYFYVPVNSGKYKLMGTSLTGCSNFSDPIDFIITNILDGDDTPFYIYPNPCNGIINFGDNLKIDFAELIDVTGSSRLSSEVSQNKLDISKLNDGFYLIRASSTEKTYWRKFYLVK
ncbi:MAG: T9SS type A sorting domain-containing protein, partial [Bacteroidota bacterium]